MTASEHDPAVDVWVGLDDPRIPKGPLGNDGLTDDERAWFLERFLDGVGSKQVQINDEMGTA